ncbi:hypothetical protein [Duganella callida]|uniref:Uncharacterized protein n=1 Tax=Duganella callida TaxID=2561932 RepID=A0A4Y9S4E8_9BURK|nr:hypothetical protein [Duganella callida]TFW14839.1 hypothetical protein E4L98_27385 [Duganella callida]
MIKYANLGAAKQLNEIVLVGSHDAGITGGGANAQTQNLDIGGQARAGVRFFDLRIAAFSTKTSSYGAKQTELKAFHADGMLHAKDAKVRSVVGFSGTGEIQRSKLHGGTDKGESLIKMLRDARSFVKSADFAGEFLILKFDKCTNWGLIADLCREHLGDALYTGGGNINTLTLGALAGKVVAAFMPDGYAALDARGRAGITPIKNLYKPPADYDPNFGGLQYWGAGGTSATNGKSHADKVKENIKKQSKILAAATTGVQVKKTMQFARSVEYANAPANPNIMGMMYWTTTGLIASIEERNNEMWSLANLGGLDKMWLQSFKQVADFFEQTLPQNIDMLSYGSGGTLKMFMPNIVMIDFADDTKCSYIYGLNTVAASKLVAATRAINGLV